MSTRTVQPGEVGADYVSTANKTLDLFIRFAVTFVTRYVKPGHSAMELYGPERDALFTMRRAVTIVYESNERAILGGARQGQIDGYLAALDCAALGYPYTCAIFAAVDTDVVKANSALCRAYLLAFYAACHPYAPGLYGDTEAYLLVRDVVGLVWCKPNAGGWDAAPELRQYCHIWQGHEDKTNGWDYPNKCQHPFLAWTGLTPDDSRPVIGPGSTGALVVALQYFLMAHANQGDVFGPGYVLGTWDDKTTWAWATFAKYENAKKPGTISPDGTVRGHDWDVIAFESQGWDGLYSHGFPVGA